MSPPRSDVPAAARQPPVYARLQAYGVNHLRALVFSLGKLYRAPLSSLLTLLVIAVALALPSGLYMILTNLHELSGGWDRGAQISVVIKDSVPDAALEMLTGSLLARPDVGAARAVTREQALMEFRELSGFGQALDALDENPLPALILVTPAAGQQDPHAVEALAQTLGALPEVEAAELDLQWVHRLHAMIDITRRGLLILAGMLGLAVLLVVGNTIRLDIQNRRDEIEVAKLVGATDGFIRRPFLYGGLWLGLFGGILALVILAVAQGLLHGPVRQLAGLYGSSFRLAGLGGSGMLWLLFISSALGLLGSWITVDRHLRDIEPR